MIFASIIGNPVEHSISPDIYQYLFDYFEVDKLNYSKTTIKDSSDLQGIIESFDFVNITYPSKEDSIELCDTLSKSAKLSDAVNFIINEKGIKRGFNTDGVGFLKSIEKYKNVNNILIIGAGSTARAAVQALKNHYNVTVVNRSEDSLKHQVFQGVSTYAFENFSNNLKYDLVVNMTSIGLTEDSLVFEEQIENILLDAKVVIDVVYGKNTKLLQLAKEINPELIIKNGEDLLLSQANISFQLLTGEMLGLSYSDIEFALENFKKRLV